MPSPAPDCAPCAARDEEITQLQEQLAARDAEVTGLHGQVTELKDRIARLERAASRNSGNSSMPPSGDDTPGRKPPRKKRRAAERDAAKKRSRGKQPGTPGAAMTWTVPDDTFGYYPEGTCACGADLGGAADLGVVRSYQQKEVPEPKAQTIQHDLHETRCACGKIHVAPRPPGVPDSAVSTGPRLRALAVYLLVFQHVPVERCRLLLSDVAGAQVSAGFIRSCLEKAASMAAGTVKLIKTLLIAAKVVGFDETTLRSGAAGEKKFVHGAFTGRYSLFHLGTRSLASMKDFGILTGFAGIAVTGRYGNYFHATWKNISGHQACIAHILRDLQDCAEACPGKTWPAQAREALRKLIHARNQASDGGLDAIPAGIREPLELLFRRAITVALADVPRVPGPKNSTKQHPGRDMPEFCRDREADILRFTTDTDVWPTNNISESGLRPTKTQQKISGRLTSDDTTRDRLDTRSYIDTARKHGCDVLDVLHALFTGSPWMPPVPGHA
ncbi:MAG: IS66 family transposase [Streptosporangiaceae bacterium]